MISIIYMVISKKSASFMPNILPESYRVKQQLDDCCALI